MKSNMIQFALWVSVLFVNSACSTPIENLKKETLEIYSEPISVTKTGAEINPLKMVFEYYFELKDALVKTNKTTASSKAEKLLEAMNAIKIEVMDTREHNVWAKLYPKLSNAATMIAQSKDIGKQRNIFTSLSTNMYELMKVSKMETPVYYQYCPMANQNKGAHWLSKEAVILNPYFGTEMLSCGKVQEIIK